MHKKFTLLIGISMAMLIISSISLSVVIPLFKPKVNVTFYPSQLMSYPGHTGWLLADVESEESAEFEVKTSADIPIEWKTWRTGNSSYLVEIFFTPDTRYIDNEINIELIASSESRSGSIGIYSIDVINWTSSSEGNILDVRDHFIQYIESNTIYSNLNSSTIWNFCGSPAQILIVEHYLFQSEFWELEVSRHVMIAPHDWVQVYIRPRNQTSPLWAAKIDSWSLDNASIYEITPPSEIFR